MEPLYDYVVVGAGSAGCVLADRLTASGRHRVLLLEAGGRDAHGNHRIPAAFPKLFRSAADWGYETVPQPHLDGRRLYQPRGKVLGGSSSINAMIYIRGHRLDYDGWAAAGCDGWGFADVLPYFNRSEDQQRIRSEHHGVGGPLGVCDGRYTNELSHAFVAATRRLGFPANDDFNGSEQDGFGLYQVTQRDGARASASTAFLRPAMRRRNLTVWTDAHVRSVVVEDGRAVGVVVDRAGETRTVRAGAEVVLSAGAFGSPQLLLLSGVGPASELAALDIPVTADVPGVGRNLQDHLVTPVAFRTGCRDSLDLAEELPRVLRHLAQYVLRRRGPFASTIAEAGGFVRSSPEEPAPDVQFHFGPAIFLDHGFHRPKGETGYTLGPKVIVPKSRGNVRLESPDPHRPPLIDPQYLADADDLRKQIWAVRLAQRIGARDAFGPHHAGHYLPDRPLDADDEIAAHIRAHSQTLYHPVGTCRMGTGTDAVVDPQLRVRGVRGLRVVDASVMPTITRGNTNAPTIMIAERGADLLLAAHQRAAGDR